MAYEQLMKQPLWKNDNFKKSGFAKKSQQLTMSPKDNLFVFSIIQLLLNCVCC